MENLEIIQNKVKSHIENRLDLNHKAFTDINGGKLIILQPEKIIPAFELRYYEKNKLFIITVDKESFWQGSDREKAIKVFSTEYNSYLCL